MNMIHHHPEEATLTAYAAGALPTALALVVACHLEYCSACRRAVAQAESLGGALLDQAEPEPVAARARTAMLELLDQHVHAPDVAEAGSAPVVKSMHKQWPAKLQRLIGGRELHQLKWRSAGPGVKIHSLDCGEGNTLLLDIAADHRVPVHSHGGTELTLILKGAYDDKLGHFTVGDVADLDGRVEHQPHAGQQGCLCLAGLDAPVRYRDWLPRLLQPIFRL